MKPFTWAVSGLLVALSMVSVGVAQAPEGPSFNEAGELLLPTGYREWVFVGSGLGMVYGPNPRKETDAAMFENVFVPRAAYRAFMATGTWPEKTILVMEGRDASHHQLLVNTGTTQGTAKYIEATVKDSKRWPDTKWGFFAFGSVAAPRKASLRLPPERFDCYDCHAKNTAVESNFIQFYPELFEAAKRFGTVKVTFDSARRF